MQKLKHIFIWLSRINHMMGFGIQSPTDYWFVRYVINEHWPYYQYNQLEKDDDWLTKKLGRLLFRIANWRQPKIIVCDKYQDYLQAGCKTATLQSSLDQVELVVWDLDKNSAHRLSSIYNKVNDRSILVVNHIKRYKPIWQEIVTDERTGVTFDLYYCGIVMFDKKRHKRNYIINF